MIRITKFSTTWGLLMAFVSGLIISLTAVIIKYLTNIFPGQLALYRFWASASFSLPHLVWLRERPLGPPGYRSAVILWGILLTSTIYLHFLAFRYLPLGEAAALISCYPALVTVAGRIFLKEPFGILQIIAVFTTITGVVLITGVYEKILGSSESYTTENIYGLVAAMASLISCTATFIVCRHLRHVHSSVLTFSSSVSAIIESAAITALLGNFTLSYRGLQQGLIILLGFLCYAGTTSMNMSTKYAEVGPVSVIRSATDIVASFIWQEIIFGETPKALAILGAILVSVSVIFVGLSNHISQFAPKQCFTLC